MNTILPPFKNPFRPGAGHMPPYLAGREEEKREFLRLLGQDMILENLILTGLRGVGKTVLLDSFKPFAIAQKWLWVGTDLSESTSVNEENICVRLFTDLAVVTSNVVIESRDVPAIGFNQSTKKVDQTLNFDMLFSIYQQTPGLVADKLKRVLELSWLFLSRLQPRPQGIIFAYDEAQNLSDQAAKEQFPLSLLLDVFQSIQKKNIPFMLLLTGLPTLFPKLVDTRTYTERMFRVVFLNSLSREESRDAILKPINDTNCPVRLSNQYVKIITDMSGGYPYFIQFVCREVYDAFLQRLGEGKQTSVPHDEILRKLDTDFFAGRWAKATDRQRELLSIIAHLPKSDTEFSVQEIVESSKNFLEKPFGSSNVNQMLIILAEAGLVYRNRHGKYAFAVPLLGQFIKRQAHAWL